MLLLAGILASVGPYQFVTYAATWWAFWSLLNAFIADVLEARNHTPI